MLVHSLFKHLAIHHNRQGRDAYLPRKPLSREMPLEHLPENHRTGEYISLVVVLGMGVPELRGLPIHCTDDTPDHRSRRLLDLGEPKIRNFRSTPRGNEDI